MTGCRSFATAQVCYVDDNGRNRPLIAHYEYYHDNDSASPLGTTKSVLVGTRYTLADGVTVVDTSPGVVTPGPCPVVAQDSLLWHSSANYASGSASPQFDPNGAGSVWDFSSLLRGLLQSVTVWCLVGDSMGTNFVSIAHPGTGLKSQLIAGMTVTFSVAQDQNVNEYLDLNFTAECVGDAAMFVAWTEQ
jgi:hypothetical protein